MLIDYTNLHAAPSIPRTIHLIWIGSDIPEQYLSNIAHYRTLTRKNNFDVKIWTDQAAHILNTAQNLGLNLRALDLQLNDIQQLEQQNTHLWARVNEERVGSHNYAAAADILRLMILQQEGGYYFDIDLVPQLEIKEHDPLAEFSDMEDTVQNTDKIIIEEFTIPDTPYGFLCYCEEWGLQDSPLKAMKPIQISNLSNHALASTPNHPIVKLALEQILENYEQHHETNDAPLRFISLNDIKRNKNIPPIQLHGGRRQLTIDASGPSVIRSAIATFVGNERIMDFSGFSFPLANTRVGIIITMTNAKVHYANTWFGTPVTKAHEMEDLPTHPRPDFRP